MVPYQLFFAFSARWSREWKSFEIVLLDVQHLQYPTGLQRPMLSKKPIWQCSLQLLLPMGVNISRLSSISLLHAQSHLAHVRRRYLTANIFESGPMPTPWKFLDFGRIPSIIDTYTKPNLVPPKRIWFPANLGLVLTQLSTWDDWKAC